eukprot:m.8143 g.8143  ORF g.8143 m.8143 type:complete len:664 (+) comp3845_c0_seq1:158-2149(+)
MAAPEAPFVLAGVDVTPIFGIASTVKLQEDVKYLGSRAIHLQKRDGKEGLTSEEAVQVAEEIKKANKAQIKAYLVISARAVGVIGQKEGVLQQAPLEYCVLQLAHPKNKKMLIYVTRNARLGLAYCHVVTGSSSLITQTLSVFEESFKATSQRRFSQLTPEQVAAGQGQSTSRMDNDLADLEAYDDTVHGVYEGRFLGGVPVKQKEGEQVISNAVVQAQKNLKKAKEPGRESILIITTDGLRVFEALTEDQMMILDLNDVSFLGVVESHGEEVIAVIECDDRLDQKNCYLWACAEQGMAVQAVQALNAAIEVARKRAEAKEDDPFYPDSFKKEAVPDELANFQIERDDLTGVKVLGAGQFGRVYLAVQSYGDDATKDVQRAVKLLRDGASASDKAEFTREAVVMTIMKHKNIVDIIGCSMVYRPWLVVLEMMQYGDLKKVLLACQSKDMQLTFIEFLIMAEQVAAALEYVAARGYIHMDVAARNALLHTKNLVKLSDFGITRPVDPETGKFRLSGQLRMAVRWMAPETLGKHPILFSEKTDVYSFGILLWELPSYGRLPFRTLKAREAKDKIRDGLMLGPPPNCPEAFYELMLGCWKRNPDDRFTFKAVRERLQGLIDREVANGAEPRDVGASVNKLLTSDFQRASMRATQKKRASRKVAPKK